jgi:hypothetical protein
MVRSLDSDTPAVLRETGQTDGPAAVLSSVAACIRHAACS